MRIFKNNVTFAILDTEGGWRTDLTERFCDYYSHHFNGDSFNKFVSKVDTIDAALQNCKTDYLFVQRSGYVAFSLSFFRKIATIFEKKQDLFLGHIRLEEDYAVIDSRCVFINVALWKKNGEPSFSAGKQKDGPKFAVSIPSTNQRLPHEIVVVQGAEREFVPSACGAKGGSAIVKQLDVFDRVTSLSNIISDEDAHFLDHDTALGEIRTETQFEKKFLPTVHDQIFAVDADKHEKIPATVVSTVCAPARGLKAHTLAGFYHAKHVIVYDRNPLALELQKRIFGVTKSTTYGEIVSKFLTAYPTAKIVDEWMADKHTVVKPYRGEVTYKHVDLFSFEAEDLIKDIDHTKSLVIDFSDAFVQPHNFYRRPIYQVIGLFAELYSLLKSRTGPTTILGFAPRFKSMDDVEINTSTVMFEADPNIDPTLPGEDGIPPPPLEPLVFTPEKPVQVIEKLTPKPPIVKRIMDVVKSISGDPVAIADDLGYVKSTSNAEIGKTHYSDVTLLSKREVLNDLVFIFDYYVNEENNAWCFKVGMEDVPPGRANERIELYNGFDKASFKKHLLNDFKINPDTIRKFFTK